MKKILFIIAALTLSAGLWAETLTVSYDYPVYNTPNDPKSGIASWQTGSVDATVVENATEQVTWGTEGQESWYVVVTSSSLGKIELTKGAVCRGDVHLILSTNELNASAENDKAGIEVSGSNSLTIYGQPNAALVALGGWNGAGIGGGDEGSGSNIIINGGTVTARTMGDGAGIGGGSNGDGSNIIINGGEVDATGSGQSAGIGGGNGGNGTNIIINGGTVKATGGANTTGIGGGGNGGISSNIFVASPILLKAGSTSDDAIETPHFTGYDMAAILKDKQSVIVEEGKATAYVEGYNAGKAAGIEEGKAELLGNMATPCTDCTAVEVTDGTTTVTLYKPTNVSYIKK